ncbi:uncharacterized protein LOC133039269 [Cannabis sativa]|uniref:uncharacterized protein LOC133039269 n=1 Tax=Cannabis sativa TaxID=3483 RepID=UPI0029CA1861|nr:uncharacterized protein LOC133039269 [Cannabis sativa]
MASNTWNMGDIDREVLNIQIAEEEEEDLAINSIGDDEGIDSRWCLVGKFLSSRSFDYDAMQNTLSSLWQPGMGMFVKKLQPNLFIFQFYHEVDIKRVIDGSPWMFDRMPLIIERLKEWEDPVSLSLNTLDIWVQIHDMDPRCMGESVLRNVGNTMGQILESDPKNFQGVWREYLRMRVTLNIDKPLRRRMRLQKDDGNWFWVNFKYERAPTFCFICGVIGHSERFCYKLLEMPADQIGKPYGEFMRAKFQKHNHNIGAKWLRTKGWVPPRRDGSGSSSRRMEEEEKNGNPVNSNYGDTNQNMGDWQSRNQRVNMHQLHGGNVGDTNAIMTNNELKIMGKKSLVGQERKELIGDNKKRKTDTSSSIGLDSTAQIIDEISMVGHIGEAQGRSGGLGLLWRYESDIRIESFSKNHIDCFATVNGGSEFRFTGIYGEPNRSLRKEIWRMLKNLYARRREPWCLMGDFNNVLSQSEKRGGNPYPQWLINGFQETVLACGLCDLELFGYPYTWEKSRDSPNWIEARLDRALVSASWLDLFQNAQLLNVEISSSDHCPLLLETNVADFTRNQKVFWFENMWLGNMECEQIIREVWHNSVGQSMQSKIESCGEDLLLWEARNPENFSQNLKKCRSLVKQYKHRRDIEGKQLFFEAKKALFEVLNQREIFWRQRSKQLWLQSGDQNSKFFHSKASARRRNNSNTCLKNENGTKVTWEDGLGDVMMNYFKDIFNSHSVEYSEVMASITPKI